MRPLELAWSVLKADPDARLHTGNRHQTIHPGALAYMRRQKELSHIPGYQEGEMPYTQVQGGPSMMTIAGDSRDYYADGETYRDMPSVMSDNPKYNEGGRLKDLEDWPQFAPRRHEVGTPHEAMMRLLDMQQGYNPQEVAGMPAFQESTRPRIGNPDGVQMLPYGNQFIPDFRQQQLEEFANERQQERLADFFYNYSE